MRRLPNKIIPLAFVLCLLVTTLVLPVSAVECKVLDGKVTFVDDNDNMSSSGNSVTIKCTAGGGWATKTNTVTMTNTSEKDANISFTWTTSSSDGCTVNGTQANSGSFSENLAAGGSITITLKSVGGMLWSETATLTISGITYVEVGSSYSLTVNTNGSGTVKLDDTTVTSGTAYPVSPTNGATLVATPSTNYSFLGWRSGDILLSTNAAYTIKPTANMTVEAVFVKTASDTAWFSVGNGAFLYNNLNQAATKAASLSDKVVVLMNNGTLPANADNPDTPAVETDYTIPASVKLLIPNSASDTGAFSGEPSIQLESNSTNSPAKVFRTLTVPSDATITCYGEINVNGHRSANGQPFDGHVIGNYGKIILGTESKTFSDPTENDLTTQLIIGEGGKLYCYGYITGSGMVHVQKSGTLHELLQLADWPGGSNGITWKGDSYNNLFLATQYYVQNIEAPLRIDYGATQYIEAVITMTYVGEIKFSAPFISSSDGLFITSGNGYVLRIYDQEQDRMNYHIKGGSCTIGVLSMNKTVMLVPYSITTENSIMPITNNISINIEDGTTFNVNKPVALLPGAEVIIQNGATANVENAAIYIYDVNDWSGIKDGKMSGYFHRVQQSISQSWAPADVNKDPKTNALPYVATLNSISPRATGYYYYPSDKNQPMTNPKPITASGKLVVNGTANIKTGGYVYVSSVESSADKVITGTGKIVHSGSLATAEKSIASGTDTYTASVNFNNALGNLAGLGPMKPFTNGGATYFGLGEDYYNNWYQHVIMVEGGATGVIPAGSSVGETGGYASGVRSVTTSAAQTTANNVVGYTVNNGTFTFTVDHDVCAVKLSDAMLAPDEKGVYTIDKITTDTTITLVEHNVVIDAAVAPTCTKTGLTEGKHCSVCNEVIVAQEVVAARGYHDWLNGECQFSGCDAVFQFASTNVAVHQGLDLYFYIDKDDVAQEGAGFYVKLTKQHADEQGSVPIELALDDGEWEDYNSTLYRVGYSDIAAKEMMDDITAVVYYADGRQASRAYTESIKKYAHNVYKQSGANQPKLGPALADMLNYGAACQILFDYNAENLANDDESDGLMNYATSNELDLVEPAAQKKGAYYYGSTFSAKNKLMFTFYFDFDEDNDGVIDSDVAIDDAYALISYYNPGNPSAGSGEIRVNYANWYKRTDTLYGIDIIGIPIGWGRTAIECSVYAGDGTIISSGNVDSIVGYANRTDDSKVDLLSTMHNLLRFVDSANIYFNSVN